MKFYSFMAGLGFLHPCIKPMWKMFCSRNLDVVRGRPGQNKGRERRAGTRDSSAGRARRAGLGGGPGSHGTTGVSWEGSTGGWAGDWRKRSRKRRLGEKAGLNWRKSLSGMLRDSELSRRVVSYGVTEHRCTGGRRRAGSGEALTHFRLRGGRGRSHGGTGAVREDGPPPPH